jgi:hypothetical protein
MTSSVARTYIFAAKLARDRAELAAWMETQRPRIERYLPTPEAAAVIDEARRHWRSMESAR